MGVFYQPRNLLWGKISNSNKKAELTVLILTFDLYVLICMYCIDYWLVTGDGGYVWEMILTLVNIHIFIGLLKNDIF